MRIVDCNYEEHGPAMLDIINEAIRNSTALYEYQARTPQAMQAWFAAKESGRFPVIGLENAAGQLLGFASYGQFRVFPAYRYTVESSVYLHPEARGKGHGKRLMRELIRLAINQDMHTLIACIDMQNRASILLHESLGFSQCGVLREAGYKFGRWLDAGFYQLVLPTSGAPVEESRPARERPQAAG